jgi:hypothetical protein
MRDYWTVRRGKVPRVWLRQFALIMSTSLHACCRNTATVACGRRANIKEARQRVASGFQPFRGMSYVLSGIARPTPVFPDQSSADIARGSARNGGINRAKNSKYRKHFLFRQLKIIEESSLRSSCFILSSFSQVAVPRDIKNILGVPSWKKGWETLFQGSTGIVT